MQAQTTKGVQVVDCSDGFIYSYFISEYCNPTGTHIEGSSNIKLYSGTNNAYGISDFFVFSLLTLVPGCTTDVDDVVGILILGSSDILLSKVNSINYKGTPFPVIHCVIYIRLGQSAVIGIQAEDSKYIGIFKSTIQGATNGYSSNISKKFTNKTPVSPESMGRSLFI